jgi:hypothetical protein
MAYSALVRHLLISCPGDVSINDLAVVHKAINRWNGIYGQAFGAVVVPISWGTHAAAEFGHAPQDILNKQLVDQCDICVALLANRLGTPTTSAESGTAEEIERLGASGRYVGILRSRRPVDITGVDLDQAQKLESYLSTIAQNALILDYATDDELTQRVDTILAAAVARDQARANLQLQQATQQRLIKAAEVWPRVDSIEKTHLIYDYVSSRPPGLSPGRVPSSKPPDPDIRSRFPTDQSIAPRSVTMHTWQLVLSNTGDAPARNVRVQFEPAGEQKKLPKIITDDTDSKPHIEILAPHGEVRFELEVPRRSARQARCIVWWIDDRGEQENAATLRLI